MKTLAARRNSVEQRAVKNMQAAFYFYEKAEANAWDTRYHGWIARADRYANAAEFGFKVSRKR